MKPPKPCIVPGCGIPFYGEGARCPKHRQPDRHKNRASGWVRYGKEYRANRAKVLKGNPTCWFPGCQAKATQADHIQPRTKNGTDQLANLRPSCAKHNASRGAGRY